MFLSAISTRTPSREPQKEAKRIERVTLKEEKKKGQFQLETDLIYLHKQMPICVVFTCIYAKLETLIIALYCQ